jgi:hypothetical protein
MRNNPRYIPNTRVGGTQSQSGEKNPWPMLAIERQLLGQTICNFVTLQKELFPLVSLVLPLKYFTFPPTIWISSRATQNMLHGAVPQQKYPAFNRTQNPWQGGNKFLSLYPILSHTFRAQTIVHHVFNIYSFSILHKRPTFSVAKDQNRPGLVRGPRVEK